MLARIISGGQTGADQGALDAAIELDIPHGGWVPKGRKTEAGPLPAKYQLKEMPTSSYSARTERNVVASDGTLILSHGPLTGGSALTEVVAKKHKKPFLHLDLTETSRFGATQLIASWIAQTGIELLNVAGPRASEDPDIYLATKEIMRTVIKLCLIAAVMPDPSRSAPYLPRTVDETVEGLISQLSLKDKVQISRMDEDDVEYLFLTLGGYIRTKYLLWGSNKELMDSCREVAGEGDLSEDCASMVIVRSLWQRLRESHKIRAFKRVSSKFF